jgi:hypothetical protein
LNYKIVWSRHPACCAALACIIIAAWLRRRTPAGIECRRDVYFQPLATKLIVGHTEVGLRRRLSRVVVTNSAICRLTHGRVPWLWEINDKLRQAGWGERLPTRSSHVTTNRQRVFVRMRSKNGPPTPGVTRWIERRLPLRLDREHFCILPARFRASEPERSNALRSILDRPLTVAAISAGRATSHATVAKYWQAWSVKHSGRPAP